jgi:hypothetical protein
VRVSSDVGRFFRLLPLMVWVKFVHLSFIGGILYSPLDKERIMSNEINTVRSRSRENMFIYVHSG